MSFFKPKQETKKEIDIDIIDTIYKRLDKAEAKIRKLESESLDLNNTIDSLRNKVLRKIQKQQDSEEVVKKEPKIGEAYF